MNCIFFWNNAVVPILLYITIWQSLFQISAVALFGPLDPNSKRSFNIRLQQYCFSNQNFNWRRETCGLYEFVWQQQLFSASRPLWQRCNFWSCKIASNCRYYVGRRKFINCLRFYELICVRIVESDYKKKSICIFWTARVLLSQILNTHISLLFLTSTRGYEMNQRNWP